MACAVPRLPEGIREMFQRGMRSWAFTPGTTYRAYVPVLNITPEAVRVTHLTPPGDIAIERKQMEDRFQAYLRRRFGGIH